MYAFWFVHFWMTGTCVRGHRRAYMRIHVYVEEVVFVWMAARELPKLAQQLAEEFLLLHVFTTHVHVLLSHVLTIHVHVLMSYVLRQRPRPRIHCSHHGLDLQL